MKYELHSRCLSCGKKHDFICELKNCSFCNELFRNNYINRICRREGCSNPVTDPSYPMCPKCYAEVRRLDEQEVEEYLYQNRR